MNFKASIAGLANLGIATKLTLITICDIARNAFFRRRNIHLIGRALITFICEIIVVSSWVADWSASHRFIVHLRCTITLETFGKGLIEKRMDAIHTIIAVARLAFLCSCWIRLVRRALTARLGLKVVFVAGRLALRDTQFWILIKLWGRIALSAFQFLCSLIFIATNAIFRAYSTSPWVLIYILARRADFALPSLSIDVLSWGAILAANSLFDLINFETALTNLANRLGGILR